MSPILMSPPSRPSMGVLVACASTGSALTAKPAARQAATKPRRSTRTSGNRLFRSSFCKSLRLSSMLAPLSCSPIKNGWTGGFIPACSHQNDVELLLRVARFDLHGDGLADEVGEHRHRGR